MGAKAGEPLPRAPELDIRILREMYPARGVGISGIDPRLNASRIAERLGLSRARIAARLRAWAEHGFIARYEVWPNPERLGLTGVTFDVRIEDRRSKQAVIDRIGFVPGTIAGIDFAGEWVAITFLLPIGDDGHRTASLLRGIAGVAEVGRSYPWTPNERGRPLTPLERRVVKALRRYPRDSLASIARHVGVSTRTITSRYGRLLDDQAVWFIPVFDFRAMAEPVVSLNIEFASSDDGGAFRRAFSRAYPDSIEFVQMPFGPILAETMGTYFAVVPSAARVESLENWVRSFPGVTTLETLTLIRILSFPDTLDRALADDPTGGPNGSRGRGR